MGKLRIVFMGTPSFGIPSLKAILAQGHEVLAVITAPDKPAARGHQLIPSQIKVAALELGLPVLQPTNLKSADFQAELAALEPDLGVVVAFRMLPEAVWSLPRLGTINLHGSLLPQYRGAAPINWAIINGELETGITTFFLKHEIDTGDLIYQTSTPIHNDDTFGTLYERLSAMGGELMAKTVDAIADGSAPRLPQAFAPTDKAAPKLSKETGKLDFNSPVATLHNFVRGLSPIPCAWAVLNDKSYKVHQTAIVEGFQDLLPIGTVVSDQKTYLHVAAADGFLSILELQAEGKRKMVVEEFFRGNKI